jgi:sugar phosphate isomerase/epimerase
MGEEQLRMAVEESLYSEVVGAGLAGEGMRDPGTGEAYSARRIVEAARALPYDGEMTINGCWIFAISIAGYHVGINQVYAALERMAKVGLRYVELEGIGYDGLAMMHASRADVLRRCRDLGLEPVNFAVILPDFTSPDSAKRAQAIESYRTLGMEVARTFPSCRTIQTDTFLPWARVYGRPPYTDDVVFDSASRGYKYAPSPDYDQRAEFAALVDTFGRCDGIAREGGLRFCIEPRKGEIVDSVGYLLRVLDQLPDLGIVLDTAHLNHGEDAVLATARLGHSIAYCHLADNDGSNNDHLELREPALGARGIDFLYILYLLKAFGYTGCLAIDTGKVPDIDAAVRRSKERLEKMLALLGIPYRS